MSLSALKILFAIFIVIIIGMPVFSSVGKSEIPIYTLSPGTSMNVMFTQRTSSRDLEQFDIVSAQLNRDLKYGTMTIAPAGSIVSGRVIKAARANTTEQNGVLSISFNKLQIPDGRILLIQTQKVNVKLQNNNVEQPSILSDMRKVMNLQNPNLIIRNFLFPERINMFNSADVVIPEGTVFQLRLTAPITVQPYLN